MISLFKERVEIRAEFPYHAQKLRQPLVCGESPGNRATSKGIGVRSKFLPNAFDAERGVRTSTRVKGQGCTQSRRAPASLTHQPIKETPMTPRLTLRRRQLIQGGTLGALALTVPALRAQGSDWPSKVIRMIVAFPAGGPTDTAARLIAQKLSTRLGQQVLVDNRPGASGSIGTAAFIKAPADGYTISMFGMPALIAPIVYRNKLYDSRKDFTCVATVYDLPYVIVINPQALPGVDNLQQLIAQGGIGVRSKFHEYLNRASP